VEVEVVGCMTRHVDCLYLKPVQGLVLIKHGS
jgi:hypothetical protein